MKDIKFGYKQYVSSAGRNVDITDENSGVVIRVEAADIPDLIDALQETVEATPKTSKYPFVLGDRVRKVKPYRMLGQAYTGVPYDQVETGVIVTDFANGGGNVYDDYENAVEVKWDQDFIRTNIDKDCLEPELIPVTDQELAEVHKILGVQ